MLSLTLALCCVLHWLTRGSCSASNTLATSSTSSPAVAASSGHDTRMTLDQARDDGAEERDERAEERDEKAQEDDEEEEGDQEMAAADESTGSSNQRVPAATNPDHPEGATPPSRALLPPGSATELPTPHSHSISHTHSSSSPHSPLPSIAYGGVKFIPTPPIPPDSQIPRCVQLAPFLARLLSWKTTFTAEVHPCGELLSAPPSDFVTRSQSAESLVAHFQTALELEVWERWRPFPTTERQRVYQQFVNTGSISLRSAPLSPRETTFSLGLQPSIPVVTAMDPSLQGVKLRSKEFPNPPRQYLLLLWVGAAQMVNWESAAIGVVGLGDLSKENEEGRVVIMGKAAARKLVNCSMAQWGQVRFLMTQE